MKKARSSNSVQSSKVEFVRTNTVKSEWRDLYRSILALSWPRFALAAISIYLVINIVFACAYLLGGQCIAEMKPGSFTSAFFYSVQTLSTVGFGHLYPTTLYGDIVTTIEIIVGMFFTAVVTGLIFVRYSRPVARLMFSESMVISKYNGKPTLQIRVANLHYQPMV